MNTIEDTQKKFICECGKQFDKIRQMTGHQSNCDIHKKKIKEIKESRRLPNGMFKCDNPKCQKEHDGSYGSGRFCSKKCKDSFNASQGNLTKIKNGTFKCNFNCWKDNYGRAPYGTWKCKECNLIFETRKILQDHNNLVHPDRKQSGEHAWNKGLTKETSKSIAKASLKVSEGVRRAYLEGKLTGRCKDPIKEELRKKKISESMKKNPKAGGKRHGSGHGIQGWYKGFYCDSSWELAVVIYWLEHDIKFERCKESFEYELDNEKHRYHPDYIFPNGEYVEVKGAEKTLQWQAKMSQFPKNKKLIVIGINEINMYLDYAKTKYGENFTDMYEKKRIVKKK